MTGLYDGMVDDIISISTAVAVAGMMIIQTFQVGEDSRDPLR